MSTASATTLPAATIRETADEFVAAGSIGAGARLTVFAHLAKAAQARGLDYERPIDGDVLDELVIDAVPAHLWTYA